MYLNKKSLDILFEEMKHSKYDPIKDPVKEVELIQEYRAGSSEAFEKLFNANFRFLISTSKKANQYAARISLGDRINAGALGMVEGIKRFDETKGFKLITYLVWWINHGIKKENGEKSMKFLAHYHYPPTLKEI